MPACFSTNVWEFRSDEVRQSERLRYLHWTPFEKMCGLSDPPFLMTDDDFSIKHLGSNIKFKFTSYDALCHWLGENLDFRKFGKRSKLPTYNSPLQPTVFDSTYIGRVLIEELDGETRDFNPVWENVQWDDLAQQVDWTEKNKLLSSPPMQSSFHPKFTRSQKKYHKKLMKTEPCFEGVTPLVSFKGPIIETDKFFYNNCYGSVCIFKSLVITHSGWFFSLCQVLSNEITVVERVRTMTMHCNFKDDIIYREIIEKQSKHFSEELFRSQVRRNETNKTDCELRVHYHEVKKLDIRVFGRIQEISAGMVRNYSVSPAEMDGMFMEEVKLPDDKIALFLTYLGSEIEDIEARTNTHIQIFPFFNVPRNPKYSKEPPRTVHVYGLQRNVEVAKDILVSKMDQWIRGLCD